MDAQPTDSPQRARGLEDTLEQLDASLAEADRQAQALLKAVRRLRRAAREGAIANLPAAIAAASAPASHWPRQPRRSITMSPMPSQAAPGSMNWPPRPAMPE
jgi:hypothetical protein